MLKIYPLSINSKFVTKKVLTKNMIIPISTIPLVAYMTDKERAIKRTVSIIKENENTHSHPVTDRTNFNTEQLKKAGISDFDIKKYLKQDGYVNDDGKKLLKEKNLSFKGSETDVISDSDVVNDVSDVPELSPRELELAEIDNIDVSLPSDLQEYLVAPLKKVGEGLLDNIMDLSDAALETSDKIFSTIKNFLSDAVDMF